MIQAIVTGQAPQAAVAAEAVLADAALSMTRSRHSYGASQVTSPAGSAPPATTSRRSRSWRIKESRWEIRVPGWGRGKSRKQP